MREPFTFFFAFSNVLLHTWMACRTGVSVGANDAHAVAIDEDDELRTFCE